jgi:hypothetical protein
MPISEHQAKLTPHATPLRVASVRLTNGVSIGVAGVLTEVFQP